MDDLTNLNCRICLKLPKSEENWKIFFGEPRTVNSFVNKMYSFVTGIQIDPLCPYALLICDSCEKNLEDSYKFIILCKKTNEIIRQYSKQIKKEYQSLEFEFCDVWNENVDEEKVFLEETKFYTEKTNVKYTKDMNNSSYDNKLHENLPHSNVENKQSLKSEKVKSLIQKELSIKKRKRKEKMSENLLIQNNKLNKSEENISESQENKFVCDVCGKSYITMRRLEFHRHLHTGIKNFNCEICGRNFAHKMYLDGHMLVHKSERQMYPCKMCNKVFSRARSKRLHEREHTVGFIFECNICGQKFTLKSYLKRHMKIHNDERPYDCKICNVSFRRNDHLIQHNKTKGHLELEKLELNKGGKLMKLKISKC